uniref:Metalloendopeptidase n=1 Tax=Meloidogyne incognita TaxID=6306 RepID=A0A914MJV7_MELIC
MRRLLPPNIIENLSKENKIKEEETLEKEEIEEETDEQLQEIPTRHIAIKQRHNNRWVDNEIPFLFSPKFSERQLIKQLGYSYFSPLASAEGYSAAGSEPASSVDRIDAKEAIRESLAVIEANSCFRFIPRDNQKDFIYFDMREGCFSFVGKVGGRQLLSLAAGCLNDYIIWHEVMHALGLEHEHQRPDRDRYIEIQWKNVEPGKEINFDKIKLTDVDIYHTYDYHSLMHYDGTAFGRIDKRSRQPMMTMRPKRDGIVLRDNLELTDLDIEKLQILSGCELTKKRKFRPKVGAVDSKDLGNSCGDRSLNCQSLAQRGFCAEIRYQRLIKIQCQQTCGFCTSILLSETNQQIEINGEEVS